eukprot:3554894-Pleurochrysis_carterae.AAC.1
MTILPCFVQGGPRDGAGLIGRAYWATLRIRRAASLSDRAHQQFLHLPCAARKEITRARARRPRHRARDRKCARCCRVTAYAI